jgi:hypothetical protein
MPWTGFEPAIPSTMRPQTYALDRAATGIGKLNNYVNTIVHIGIYCVYTVQFA